jgi:DNA-binding GntR family transcriptional regulator
MSTPLIRPVGHHHRNLRAHVEQALSAAIMTGELEPGTLLTVPTLAAQFEVSATPVREAVLDLESRGFVESVRNKGFRVTEVSPESLRQIAEVRQWLEPPAMEQLARNFPADELPGLRKLASDIVSGARTGELLGYVQADQQFHLRLAGLLGNPVLVEVIAELRSRARLIGIAAMVKTGRLEESAAEHHELLDHLTAGDAVAARALMHRHIGHTIGWWAGQPEE